MAVFDLYIEEVTACLARLGKKTSQEKVFFCVQSPETLKRNLPVQVGPGSNPGIILRSDTFVELGNPLAGSAAFVLWTDDPSLIRDGKITLIGPDVPESAGKSLPFGQILFVGGKALSEKDHENLLQTQYVADQIEGYMLKSAPDRIWSRVSKQAAKRGFDFETLGKALRFLYRGGESRIEAMEIVFVTSSKEDVEELKTIAGQVNKISREIVKESWKIRGYDIECTLDCNSCGDKPVCDDIRDVLSARKKRDQEAKESVS